MKHSFKRFVSMLLTFCIILSLLPAEALAATGRDPYALVKVYENTRTKTLGEDNYVEAKDIQLWCGDELIAKLDSGGRYTFRSKSYKKYKGKTLTVKKDGYKSKDFVLVKNKWAKVYIDHEKLVGPILKGVYMNEGSEVSRNAEASEDAENSENSEDSEDSKKSEPVNALKDDFEIDVDSKEDVYFDVDCEFSESNLQSIVLYQDGLQEKFTSLKFKYPLGKKFELAKEIRILITDDQGNTATGVLGVSTFSKSAFVNSMEKGGLNFGNSLNITIPKSVPIIGGMPISLGPSNPFPVSVKFDGSKWYGTIGVDLASYKKKEGKDGEAFGPYKTISNAFHQKDLKGKLDKFKKLRQDYKSVLKDSKGFGASGNISVMGFFEGTVHDGKPKLLDAGVVLTIEGKIGYTFPFTIVIPMFFEVNLEGSLEVTADLYVDDGRDSLRPLGQIEFKPSLSAGLGIGVAKVLSVSGGLKGILDILWKLRTGAENYFKVSGELKAYVKATIVFLTKGHEWKLGSTTFYEYPKADVTGAVMDDVREEIISSLDKDSFEVVDLSYLEESDEDSTVGISVDAAAEDPAAVGFGYVDGEGAYLLEDNLYRESQVALGMLSDGREVAVYVNGADANPDNLALYFRIHNADKWSEPKLIQNDGTADSMPVVYVQNDKIYVAWQNVTKSFFGDSADSDDVTLDSVAQNVDICVATVSDNGIIEGNITTFATDGLDTMPVLAGDGKDAVYVVWNCNKDYDWFSEKPARNAIYASKLENGSWSDAYVHDDYVDCVLSLDADVDNGKLKVAYASQANRTGESHIYENGKRVTFSDADESAPVYLNHELYWYSQGDILCSDVYLGSTGFTSDDYELMEIDGILVALYKNNDGLQSSINLAAYNEIDSEWIHGTVFASNDSNIQDFACVLDENDDVKLLVNDVETTLELDEIDMSDENKKNPYGTAHLVLIDSGSYTDAEISDVDYDADSFELGDEIEVSVEVTNTGTETVKDIVVILLDSEGKEITKTALKDNLLPAETREVTMTFTVTDVKTQRDLSVDITGEEVEPDKNTNKKVSITNENIEVSNVDYVMTNKDHADIDVIVENTGDSARENIKVDILKGSHEGEVVATANITGLQPGDVDFVTVNIPVKNGDIYYAVIEDSKIEDKNLGDDCDFVLIDIHGMTVYDNSGIDTVTKIVQEVEFNGVKYPITLIPGNGQKEDLLGDAKKNSVKLAKLTKEGYTFKGWYDKSGKKITKLTEKYLKKNTEVVLTAKWVQNQYNVKYVVTKPGKGAKPLGKPGKISKVNYNDIITLSAGPECAGYVFKGWATEKGGNVVYAPGESVSKLGGNIKKNKNVKLYSVWEALPENSTAK